jgi:N-methylhydantoinase A/oxoprolinase/acetone carboxylase beta subunit
VKGRREVFFSEVMDFVDAVVYDRQRLCTGDLIAGPAVVEEIESTTVIGPGEELTVDECLNLVINL